MTAISSERSFVRLSVARRVRLVSYGEPADQFDQFIDSSTIASGVIPSPCVAPRRASS